MDDSDRELADSAPPRRGAVVVRALLSAAVFGTIGAYFGKWLGMRGNAPQSEMAAPMMKWSMGGFWALLAAYCSLKADEPVVKATPELASASPSVALLSTHPEAQATVTLTKEPSQPRHQIETQGAVHSHEAVQTLAPVRT